MSSLAEFLMARASDETAREIARHRLLPSEGMAGVWRGTAP